MICWYCDISEKKICVENIKNTYFNTRANEYKLSDDKYRTFVSYLLLKQMVSKIYNLDLDNISIVRDKNNKPIVAVNCFYFNISHSNNIVAVAIDDSSIGIDVEKPRKIDMRVVAKYFDTMRPQLLNEKSADDEYTKQWTIYESKLKLFGSRQLLSENKNNIRTHSTIIYDSFGTSYHLSASTLKCFDDLKPMKFNF